MFASACALFPKEPPEPIFAPEPIEVVEGALKIEDECLFENMERAPIWICNPAQGTGRVSSFSAVGIFHARAGEHFDKAYGLAVIDGTERLLVMVRDELPRAMQRFQRIYDDVRDRHIRRVGADLAARVSHSDLLAVRVRQHRVGPGGSMYVLVELEAAEQVILLERLVKQSLEAQPKLWAAVIERARLLADELFLELRTAYAMGPAELLAYRPKLAREEEQAREAEEEARGACAEASRAAEIEELTACAAAARAAGDEELIKEIEEEIEEELVSCEAPIEEEEDGEIPACEAPVEEEDES